MSQQCDLLVEELLELYEDRRRYPFPDKDFATIKGESGTTVAALMPDLDMFFSTIAGYCSSVKRARSWPEQRREQARVDLAQSFFEKYPEHRQFEAHILEQKTPALFVMMSIYESMRSRLLDLLSLLEKR